MLGDHQIEVGQELRFASPHGPVTGKVLAIEPDKFMVDFNHPLAGKILNFSVKVVELRFATQEELDHGHVHDHESHD